MDEAEQLCDRLVVMDGGRIVAEGSPRELIDEHSTREVARAAVRRPARTTRRAERSPALGDRVEVLPDRLLLYTDDGDDAVSRCTSAGVDPVTSLVRRSTLEDVFLRLTGRTLVGLMADDRAGPACPRRSSAELARATGALLARSLRRSSRLNARSCSCSAMGVGLGTLVDRHGGANARRCRATCSSSPRAAGRDGDADRGERDDLSRSWAAQVEAHLPRDGWRLRSRVATSSSAHLIWIACSGSPGVGRLTCSSWPRSASTRRSVVLLGLPVAVLDGHGLRRARSPPSRPPGERRRPSPSSSASG